MAESDEEKRRERFKKLREQKGGPGDVLGRRKEEQEARGEEPTDASAILGGARGGAGRGGMGGGIDRRAHV